MNRIENPLVENAMYMNVHTGSKATGLEWFQDYLDNIGNHYEDDIGEGEKRYESFPYRDLLTLEKI